MAKVKKNPKKKELLKRPEFANNNNIRVLPLVDLIINQFPKKKLLEWKNFCLIWLYNYNKLPLNEPRLSKYLHEQIIRDTLKLIVKLTHKLIYFEKSPYRKTLQRFNEVVLIYFGIEKFGVEIQETDTMDELLLKINPDLVDIKCEVATLIENGEDLPKYWSNYRNLKGVIHLLGKRLKVRGNKDIFLYLNIYNLTTIEIAKNLVFPSEGVTSKQHFYFLKTEIEKIEVAKKLYYEKINTIFTIIVRKKLPFSLDYHPDTGFFILSFSRPYNDLLEIYCLNAQMIENTSFTILSSDSEKIYRILKMLEIDDDTLSWAPVNNEVLVCFKSLCGFVIKNKHQKLIDFYYNIIKSPKFKSFLETNNDANFDKKFEFLKNFSDERRSIPQAFFTKRMLLANQNNNNASNEVTSDIDEVTGDDAEIPLEYDTTEAIGYNIKQCENSYDFIKCGN